MRGAYEQARSLVQAFVTIAAIMIHDDRRVGKHPAS